MKKLNRKGFTLIELLAIIVILAIIMVVTIPTVLNSMGDAKASQLQNAANSVSEWLEKQYSLQQMGSLSMGETVNPTFEGSLTDGKAPSSATDMSNDLLEAAGIADAATNIESAKWHYNATKGRMCVSLTGAEKGSFGNVTKTSTGC